MKLSLQRFTSPLRLASTACIIKPSTVTAVLSVMALGLVGHACTVAAEPKSEADSATHILKWKDGKKACVMLGFDDSAPSQLKNVVPELEKRKIVGNFYLVTGHSLWANTKAKWEEAAKSPYVVVANHTFTHKGVEDAAQLDPELAKCNEVLYALHPERKQPYLLGWGRPGGVPWKVTKEEQEAALTKHHLVDRPPFAGPPINYHSAAETVAAVDKALAKGDMVQLVFHGVGGDWLTTPLDWFTALLDKLEASREELWVADVVSWHQYETERKTAAVKVLSSGKTSIRLNLTCQADSTLYDLPLTLATKVPADWKNCLVVQGQNKTSLPVRDGAVQYSATPGAGEISIQPATSAGP
ncbi:MAG: hypothetical protein QOE70_3898 [Chthoniobacter sp.]|jgi:hypothetical protein|nr:hypothetical protein [Chthoniobacter sp.]